MTQQLPGSSFAPTSQAVTSLAALLFSFALMLAATQAAQAQTYRVIYNFTGGEDGKFPSAGVRISPDGNLYGTTEGDQRSCGFDDRAACGTVFRLKNTESGWVIDTLYTFRGANEGTGSAGGNDGAAPAGTLTFGADGSLYGTTSGGGIYLSQQCFFGCGTVFELTPTPAGPWKETLLHRFTGSNSRLALPDGANPYGSLLLGRVGNIYGVAGGGLTCDAYGAPCGVAYELAPSAGTWNESVIHYFGSGNDGYHPSGDMVFDPAGNLYGTTSTSGYYGPGIVFQLRPSAENWTEKILHTFSDSQPSDNGISPFGGLTFGQSGNLYGTTFTGDPSQGGTLFELSPSGGQWLFRTLYEFAGQYGSGPDSTLVADSAGNFYGARLGTLECGTVFELSPSNGGWNYSEFHSFSGADPEGGCYVAPYLVRDANGNLFGTTYYGGTHGYGVVFEITP